jgi:hypothetical protein
MTLFLSAEICIEWAVIRKTKVNFVRERFSACQNRRLIKFLFINDCDEKASF